MRGRHVLQTLAFLMASSVVPAQFANAQQAAKAPSVHIVYMGGNDCPPCVAWRRTELPKLEKSAEFASVKFSYVTKVIASSVPPGFFLPGDVKPYKDKLDDASSGRVGSPQVAILVNGEVFDYFLASRSAEEYERMLAAVRTGTTYPFDRCVKLPKTGRKCEKRS
jgi:hypothetical protein